jgi:arylformamidase
MAAAVYRGLDRAELDRQLNLRARWPDHQDYFDRWARDSAAVRARLPAQLDLAYGDTPGQTLDLFPAAPGRAGGGAPLLTFIHGGYWQGLDKGDFSYLAPPFVEAGIAFASLNYDLAPAANITQMVDQVRRALAWLAGEAETLGIDRGRIFVSGHSAGGHLALEAASTDWTRYGRPADLVKGACGVSGVYELLPIRLSYHQDVVGLSEAEVEDLSPLRHVPTAAGPLICAVGEQETEEFLIQQEELIAAWRAKGLDARAVAMPGRQHFTAVDALGEPDHPLFAAMRDLILAPGRP